MPTQNPAPFDVVPNPAYEGGDVTISGDPGETIYITAPGQAGSKVTVGAKGTVKIKVPVSGGQSFTVTSLRGKGSSKVVQVQSNSGKKRK